MRHLESTVESLGMQRLQTLDCAPMTVCSGLGICSLSHQAFASALQSFSSVQFQDSGSICSGLEMEIDPVLEAT